MEGSTEEQHVMDLSARRGPWPAGHLRELPVGVRELIAGGVAGALAKSCVAPLERCKILFQTGKLRSGSVHSTLLNIYQTEGVKGLFRGNGASVLRIVPYSAFHFSTYEGYRRALVNYRYGKGAAAGGAAHPHAIPPSLDLVAGSAAGATAVAATYPLDLVRTRLAFATEANSTSRGPAGGSPAASSSSSSAAGAAARAGAGAAGSTSSSGSIGSSTGGRGGSGAQRPLHALSAPGGGGPAVPSTIRGVLSATLRREGVRGVYHGVGASFYGILPYAGLKFYVYQHLKQWYHREGLAEHLGSRAAGVGGGAPRLPVPVMLAFGALAGLVAQSFTYPFDVVRRRMQVEGLLRQQQQQQQLLHGGPPPAPAPALRSTPQALRLIWRQQGWRTLYAGLSINYMKVVPSTAIGFAAYDYLKSTLDLPTNL